MKILCSICARGNSKGLRNKNLKKLNGKSLLARNIELAKKTKLFDKIVCSSESVKILNVAKKHKVDLLIKRPSNLSRDKTSKLAAIKHLFKSSENYFKYKFDLIVDLDVSAPLKQSSDIKKCINIIKKEKTFRNLVTLSPSRKNPYFNMVEIDNKGKLKLVKSKKKITARQQAPKVYDVNAGIYAWNRLGIKKNKHIINKNTLFHITSHNTSIDIDTIDDFKLVKYFQKKMKKYI